MNALLSVRGLRIMLPTGTGMSTVVDGIDFDVQRQQVFGIAGESGSGKTMTVLALLGLLPDGAILEGSAKFEDRNLLTLRGRSLRDVRGAEIAMVFQDPMTSLHPMMTIERQLTEHVRFHMGLAAPQARQRAVELLNEVRIPNPRGALHAYPHQFSGGMRQRIAIAIALACSPKVLIADEPTTALDVTVQAGILRLLDRLRVQSGLSVVMITHDLGVMSSIADWLSVMYAGRIVESGRTSDVLARPRHPYTAGLLAALPHPEAASDMELRAIKGSPPSPTARPAGCAFHPRCQYAQPSCSVDIPALVPAGDGRTLACPVDPFAVPV